MSQVDDWSDGYTSDYLRDLNTYGPASANVPRSSVVSHQVRYRAPDTSDIPLAPGQNPEGSVYSNASGARMGQTKPRSGYTPPAGGGYTAKTFPSSGGSGRRYARPKKQTQVSKPAGKTQSAASAKRQVQNYGSYRDLSDPMSQRILANGSPESKPPVESAVSRAQDITDQSDMYRAIAGLSSPPSANDSGAGAGSASVPETNFNRGLMGGVGRQVESMRAPDSEQPAPESSSIADQFKNMPWYEDAKAHHEAVKKNVDDYGYALGTLKSTWDDIPWWTKLVMLPPVFKAGSPAAGASTTGNVWVEEGLAATGDATAGAKAFEEALSRMNGGAVRGAPVEGTARRSFSSAAEGRRLYGPVAEGLLAPKGPLTGGARTALTSADEGLPVGYSILRNPKIDTSSLAGQTSSLVEQLRAAGIPEDQIAASIARINAGAAGREAAAAGREAAAAGEQAAGREAAGAATGSVSEGVDSASQQLIEHIRSGTLDEMERAWIEATAAGAAKAPGTVDASTQAILNEARAAGILGRDAAGTAGAGRAGEAAGGAPKTGAGEATGTLSAYNRQQYRNYINMVQNDPDLVDLVLPTLDRVGGAGRSIDSLSDAELSEFYNALNDAVNSRWTAELFVGL